MNVVSIAVTHWARLCQGCSDPEPRSHICWKNPGDAQSRFDDIQTPHSRLHHQVGIKSPQIRNVFVDITWTDKKYLIKFGSQGNKKKTVMVNEIFHVLPDFSQSATPTGTWWASKPGDRLRTFMVFKEVALRRWITLCIDSLLPADLPQRVNNYIVNFLHR